MDILFLLIPMSVALVLLIGAVFWWAVRSGQFDDLDGPAHRILADDDSSDVVPHADAQRKIDATRPLDLDQSKRRDA